MGQQTSKKSKKSAKDRDDEGLSVKVLDPDHIPSDDEGSAASPVVPAVRSDAKDLSLCVLFPFV